MKDKVLELFNDYKEKFGSVVWKSEFFGVELALTEKPYPDGKDDWGWERYFFATAMDKGGNRWNLIWYIIPDIFNYTDYTDLVEDWNKPDKAELVEIGFYLDK